MTSICTSFATLFRKLVRSVDAFFPVCWARVSEFVVVEGIDDAGKLSGSCDATNIDLQTQVSQGMLWLHRALSRLHVSQATLAFGPRLCF
jgi:hypothetical protein